MRLPVPAPSLVVLVGPSGCGKSTFARRHFAATEIVSSDACRALVADDEGDQSATGDAFDVLHLIVARRLRRARLTVVDATNVQPEARRPLLDLARRYHLPAVAVVFDLPEHVCAERNRAREGRTVPEHAISLHLAHLRRSLASLEREGFRRVHVLRRAADVEGAEVAREPLPADRRHDRGPFDIIGDVHGCGDELEALLAALGYAPDAAGVWRHPLGRRVIFLGDLVDRGPRVVDVLTTAMAMADAGTALCLPGNHDDKLRRALQGRDVTIAHGLERSLEELRDAPEELRRRVCRFVDRLPSHLVLDGGRLVVAHAGMKASLQGRESRRVRDFALYGDTTGEVDELGLPIRYQWAADYHGDAAVVYGHTPVPRPEWVNGTVNIDTGCVFGGQLTALRWPERELVAVPSRARYAETRRAFLEEADG